MRTTRCHIVALAYCPVFFPWVLFQHLRYAFGHKQTCKQSLNYSIMWKITKIYYVFRNFTVTSLQKQCKKRDTTHFTCVDYHLCAPTYSTWFKFIRMIILIYYSATFFSAKIFAPKLNFFHFRGLIFFINIVNLLSWFYMWFILCRDSNCRTSFIIHQHIRWANACIENMILEEFRHPSN